MESTSTIKHPSTFVKHVESILARFPHLYSKNTILAFWRLEGASEPKLPIKGKIENLETNWPLFSLYGCNRLRIFFFFVQRTTMFFDRECW